MMKNLYKRMYRCFLAGSILLTLSACEEDNKIAIPSPSVDTWKISSATVGDELSITGENIHLISAVKFGAETVVTIEPDKRTHTALTFQVPAIPVTDTVPVQAVYNTSKTLMLCEAFEVIVPPVIPVVTGGLPESAKPGEVITLTGENLEIIKAVYLGEEMVEIRIKNETTLSFVVPAREASATLSLRLVYDNVLGNDQSLVVAEEWPIEVVVSAVYVWSGVVIGGQATGQSFLNATTGEIITPCDLFAHQSEVDFMMNVSSDGMNTLYGPHNATNTLKNQKCDGQKLGQEDGKDYSVFLSVTTKFRLLKTSDVEGAVVDLVNAGQITDLSDEFFTGIDSPSSSAPKGFTVGQVYWFKNASKGKNGLFKVVALTDGSTTGENTMTLDVYYEK